MKGIIRRFPSGAAVALVLSAATVSARADDLIGFYGGAGIGQSNVKDGTIGFNQHDFAWQLTAGLRPIHVIGAEIDYVSFGEPHANIGGLHVNARERAAAAFGVLYLPIPAPLFDVYGKAGLGRVQNQVNTTGECVSFNACGLLNFNRTGTQFAWGVGGQIKFGNLALRTEYEGFNATGGSQAIINVGILFTFF